MPNASDRPTPENGTRSSLRVRLHYLASVTVNFPGPTSINASVTIQRDFVRAGRNIFDNFYFGTQKATEMHPGAPMYISGTCYIGGDLYTAHDYLHFLKGRHLYRDANAQLPARGFAHRDRSDHLQWRPGR